VAAGATGHFQSPRSEVPSASVSPDANTRLGLKGNLDYHHRDLLERRNAQRARIGPGKSPGTDRGNEKTGSPAIFRSGIAD